MMNCPDFKAVLIEFLDGRLDPRRAAEASSHIATCAACAREAELHRRTWDLAGRIEPIEPGPGFAASVGTRIRRRRVLTILVSCAAAAALLLGIFLIQKQAPAQPRHGDSTASQLPAEDRALLEELARDRTWELADNMDVIRAYELLDNGAGAPSPEEDH